MGADRRTALRTRESRSTAALAGRGALVTGASSGIGRAIALRLAEAGASVLATGRNHDALTRLAKEAAELDLAVHHHAADVTRPADRALLAGAARGELPNLAVVVHSAGLYHRGPIVETPLAELDRLLDVTVRASYALTRTLLPDLIAATGDVVFVNSTQGLAAGPDVGAYAAAKQALRAVADSLRAEVAADGVRVCSVFPGRTATPMQQQIFAAEGRRWNADDLVDPDDIAVAVTTAVTLPPRTTVTEMVVRPTRRLDPPPRPIS